MLDVRTTSRVVELADTGKMAQLEKGRTFDSYAYFIKEVESYEEKTCTKFVKRGAKTVAAKNKEIVGQEKLIIQTNLYIQVSDWTANTQVTQIRQGKASAPIRGE